MGSWDAGNGLARAWRDARWNRRNAWARDGGDLRSSCARLWMNVRWMNVHLPAANEGKVSALHERIAKKQSTAAQPRARCGTTSCAAPPAEDEAGYQESASARCVSKD